MIYLLTILFLMVAIISVLVLIKPVLMGALAYNFTIKSEAKYYGFKKSSIEINDIKISYYHNTCRPKKDRDEETETILMLHGFSADKNVWLRFARYFRSEYNIIIPDLAGHGETGFKRHWGYSAHEQAKLLASFVEKLKIEKLHIIGNSMGGFIAAHFALIYPQKLLTMTLVDAAGVKSPEMSKMEHLLVQGINPFEINTREDFDQFYSMTMAKPPWMPHFILSAIAKKYQRDRKQLMFIWSQFVNPNDMLDSCLHNISIPVLLVWGGQDQIIHVSSSTIWQSKINNAKVHIFPEIGHMPMVETPKATAFVYKNFLNNITK